MTDHNSLAASQDVGPEGARTPQDPLQALLAAEPARVFPLGNCSEDNPTGLADARANVAKYCTNELHLLEDTVVTLVLGVSETIGNVERHTNGHVVDLAVRRGAGRVVISIEAPGTADGSAPEHATLPTDNATAEGGRGLFLLEALGIRHWSSPVEHPEPPAEGEDPVTTAYWLDLAA